MNRNVKIYVATHKKYKYLNSITDPIYIPIHAGKAIYDPNMDFSTGYLPELGDDTGDNISSKNPNYCELSVMYWIWKNDDSDPDDIVGLNHYRRYFSEPWNIMKPLSKETIIDLLSKNHFIVDGAGTEINDICTYDKSVYKGYDQCHIISDLDNSLEAIQKMFPSLYFRIKQELIHSSAMDLCNLIVAKKRHFDRYCSFLFPVLAYVESKIDFNDGIHDGYNARVFGFLGERLFRPWIMATGFKAVGVPGLDWEHYSGYEWE